MSITKPNQTISGAHGTKSRIWTVETVSTWLIKLILNMAFFFTFLYIGETQLDIRRDYIAHFIYVFIFYIISGIMSVFFSYIIIKFMFGKYLHRQVKDFKLYVKGRLQRKKIWIYILSIGFTQYFFFFFKSFRSNYIN